MLYDHRPAFAQHFRHFSPHLIFGWKRGAFWPLYPCRFPERQGLFLRLLSPLCRAKGPLVCPAVCPGVGPLCVHRLWQGSKGRQHFCRRGWTYAWTYVLCVRPPSGLRLRPPAFSMTPATEGEGEGAVPLSFQMGAAVDAFAPNTPKSINVNRSQRQVNGVDAK